MIKVLHFLFRSPFFVFITKKALLRVNINSMIIHDNVLYCIELSAKHNLHFVVPYHIVLDNGSTKYHSGVRN